MNGYMVRAGLWVFLGTAGHQLSNLVVVVVLARLLTPESFGVVAAGQILISLSFVVCKFGIGTALVQSTSLSTEAIRSAQTLMLLIALMISSFLLIGSKYISTALNTPELESIMPIILLSFICSAASNVSTSLISREMNFRFLSTVDLLTFVFGYGVISIVLAKLGFSYWAIVIGTLVQSVLRCVCVLWKCPVFPTIRLNVKEIGSLMNFGGGVFLAQIISNFAQRADNLIVAGTMGTSALGYYSRAYSLMELSNGLLGTVFRQTLFTGFSKIRREGQPEKSREQKFLAAHSFAAFLILPISLVMLVLSEEIVTVLLGNGWEQSIAVLEVLSLGMFFRLNYKVSHSFNLSEGKVYKTAALTAIYALTVVIGAWVGSKIGMVGVAYGVLFALIVNFILLTSLAISIMKSSWVKLFLAVFPFFVSVLTAYVLVMVLQPWILESYQSVWARIFTQGLLMLVLYFGTLIPFRSLSSVKGVIRITKSIFVKRKI